MTAPDDNFARDVERVADEYARQHGHAPITEDRAAQMWDEAPEGYVGRRRANEDGTPMRPDDETVAWLVDSRIAWYLGDRERWQRSHWIAYELLLEQGHTEQSAAVAIGRVADDVTAKANELVIGMQQAAEDFSAAWQDIADVDDFLDQIRKDSA